MRAFASASRKEGRAGGQGPGCFGRLQHRHRAVPRHLVLALMVRVGLQGPMVRAQGQWVCTGKALGPAGHYFQESANPGRIALSLSNTPP